MQPSLANHLFKKILPLAFILNFLLNAAAALLVYFNRQTIPLRGQGGVQRDFFVAALIIGFLTTLATLPGARREVWAGRARGFGIAGLRVPNRHPLTTSILMGILSALVFTLFAVRALDHLKVLQLTLAQFVVFKALFASAVGVFTAATAALLAVAPESSRPGNAIFSSGEAPGIAPGDRLDYFDKGALAVTDQARGCNGTPLWQLLVEGALEPVHVRAALGDLVTRFPSLATRVRPLDGAAPWASHYCYRQDAQFTLDAIFRVASVNDSEASLAALCREEMNRPFDPFRDFPVTLTLALVAEDRCRLLFRQHHMIADGRAFLFLLQEFARFLEHARQGTRPGEGELLPVGRRGELEPLGLTPLRRTLLTARGMLLLLSRVARMTFSPLTPMLQNQSRDYTGDNGTLHLDLPDTLLERLRGARERASVSLNSCLTGALLEAAARWHRQLGKPLGRTVTRLLVETRPRDRAFLSFANHLAMHEVSVDLRRTPGAVAAMQQVQREVDAQRASQTPLQQLLAQRIFVLAFPLADLQRIVFESRQLSSNLDFSNLIALACPPMRGAGWRVGALRVTTTVAPRTGIIVTVLRYDGRLTFNFNYKSSAATREETRAFAEQFAAVLSELAGVPLDATFC